MRQENSADGLARVHNNIGLCLLEKRIFDEALENFKISLSLKQGLENDIGTARTLSNIAHCYLELDQVDKSLENFQKAHELKCNAYDGQINEDIATSWQNYGQILLKAGNQNKANFCFRIALEIKENFNSTDRSSKVVLMFLIGHTSDETSEKIEMFQNALNIVTKLPQTHFLKDKIIYALKKIKSQN